MYFLSSRLDPAEHRHRFGDPRHPRDLLRSSQRVVELAEDAARRSDVSDAMRAVAAAQFDTVRYVEAIDALGREAVEAKAREQRDHRVIADHQGFNADLYLGPLAATMTADEAIDRYLHASRLVVPRDRPRSGLLVRRPLEGFHPFVYAAENPQYDEASGEDPLAHYCRTGRPDGRWRHEIIRPGVGPQAAVASLRIGIHGHFHYLDLLLDFLVRVPQRVCGGPPRPSPPLMMGMRPSRLPS
jgi:hypothetical protein